MYQRVFLGKQTNPANSVMNDIGLREKLILAPIILMMLWIGVYSDPFLRRMEASLQLVQQRIENARSMDGFYRVERLQGGVK
jgi:NADH-quinone oxidoreductase subunit M